jgi:hypothetical protein
MITHIPHSIRTIPEHYLQLFVPDVDLSAELLKLTDAYTDELYAFPGATSVVFPLSRLLVDVERFPDDAKEEMAKIGMGWCYTHTSDGRPLKRELTPDERQRLIEFDGMPIDEQRKFWEKSSLPHTLRIFSGTGHRLKLDTRQVEREITNLRRFHLIGIEEKGTKCKLKPRGEKEGGVGLGLSRSTYRVTANVAEHANRQDIKVFMRFLCKYL